MSGQLANGKMQSGLALERSARKPLSDAGFMDRFHIMKTTGLTELGNDLGNSFLEENSAGPESDYRAYRAKLLRANSLDNQDLFLAQKVEVRVTARAGVDNGG